jgi:lipopolysaccharide biosynthesis glycosyltransferase
MRSSGQRSEREHDGESGGIAIRVLIVTATDENYLSRCRELIESLQRCGLDSTHDLACLDLGLAPESREWLHRCTGKVVIPGWDLPVDDGLARSKPHLRGLTARPFLPRYFPGYDLYLWLDADTSVQDALAVGWLLQAAQHGALAAVPETDRSYSVMQGSMSWRFERLKACYGSEAAQMLLSQSYLNAGVFALRGDAPHWKAWENWFRQGLENTGGTICSDQTALNFTVWSEGLPVHPLPALCNWLCHLAMPVFDPATGWYHEPHIPSRRIGILHWAGDSKERSTDVVQCIRAGADGTNRGFGL